LSYEPSNHVYTFDEKLVESINTSSPLSRSNISFLQQNINDQNYYFLDLILGASIIFMDIHSVSGNEEWNFFQNISKEGYTGFWIIDDIRQSPLKEKFSNFEEYYYCDLSHIGHWTGTAIICSK